MADRYGNYGNQDVEAWRRIPNRDEPKMEAEPSLLQRIARSIANDPTAGASPNVLVGLSMKNPANARRIASMMAESGEGGSPMSQALAYMKAKYPRLTSGIRAMIPTEIEDPYTYGQYLPDKKVILVAKDQSAPEGVDTLGHELTHSIQDARGQRVPEKPSFSFGDPNRVMDFEHPLPGTKPTLSGPGLGRGSGSPFENENVVASSPTNMYDIGSKLYGYSNNPYEVQARQGGRTALQTYRKFNEHLKEGGP